MSSPTKAVDELAHDDDEEQQTTAFKKTAAAAAAVEYEVEGQEEEWSGKNGIVKGGGSSSVVKQAADVEYHQTSSFMEGKKSYANTSSSLLRSPPSFEKTGWMRQLSCVLRFKNALLLWRRPLTLLCMLTSSIGSVLLAWAFVRNPANFDATQLTQCGSINNNNYDSDLTLNESWRDGLAVTILGKGYCILRTLRAVDVKSKKDHMNNSHIIIIIIASCRRTSNIKN